MNYLVVNVLLSQRKTDRVLNALLPYLHFQLGCRPKSSKNHVRILFHAIIINFSISENDVLVNLKSLI